MKTTLEEMTSDAECLQVEESRDDKLMSTMRTEANIPRTTPQAVSKPLLFPALDEIQAKQVANSKLKRRRSTKSTAVGSAQESLSVESAASTTNATQCVITDENEVERVQPKKKVARERV